MREILFRGKRVDNGEWVEGYYVKITSTTEVFHQSYKAIVHCIFPSEENSVKVEVIPETVRRFTGLTDKNGKRIFEGDIFKFPDEVWESSYTPCGTEWDSRGIENYGVVGFDEYTARFDFIQYKYNENSVEADLHENNNIEFADFVKELEIFGNIHDNKEILNVK